MLADGKSLPHATNWQAAWVRPAAASALALRLKAAYSRASRRAEPRMLYLISTAHLKPGTREACLEHAHAIIAASRAEPGCLSYDVHMSLTDPDRIVLIERWADRAALDAHFKTEHFQAWRAAIADCVVSRRMEIITPAAVEVP